MRRLTLRVTVIMHAAERGGRARELTSGYDGRYRPHLRVCGSDELLGVELVRGPAELTAEVPVIVELRALYDLSGYRSLRPGTEIEILEGPHVVGHGRVEEIIEQ